MRLVKTYLPTSWAPEKDLQDELGAIVQAISNFKHKYAENEHYAKIVTSDWNADLRRATALVGSEEFVVDAPARLRATTIAERAASHNLDPHTNTDMEQCNTPTMKCGKRYNGFICSRDWGYEGIKKEWGIRSDHKPAHMVLNAVATTLINITVTEKSKMWGFRPAPASAARMARRRASWISQITNDIRRRCSRKCSVSSRPSQGETPAMAGAPSR